MYMVEMRFRTRARSLPPRLATPQAARLSAQRVTHWSNARYGQDNPAAAFLTATNLLNDDMYDLANHCCEGSLLIPNSGTGTVTVNTGYGLWI